MRYFFARRLSFLEYSYNSLNCSFAYVSFVYLFIQWYDFSMNEFMYIFLPRIVEAAPPPIPSSVKTFIGKISTEILNPLIAIMFAVATVYFFYGIARYIWNPDNEEAREKGRQSMFWGVIGMFIMVAVFGIMKFLISSIGADPTLMDYV